MRSFWGGGVSMMFLKHPFNRKFKISFGGDWFWKSLFVVNTLSKIQDLLAVVAAIRHWKTFRILARKNSDLGNTVDGRNPANQLIGRLSFTRFYTSQGWKANQLRLVDYPVIYKVLAPSQVISWISEPSTESASFQDPKITLFSQTMLDSQVEFRWMFLGGSIPK